MFALMVCTLLPNLVYSSSESINFNATYNVYSVTAFNNRERHLLYYYDVKNRILRFLSSITNEAVLPMRVLVDDCCGELFEQSLRQRDIEYNFLHVRNYTIKKTDSDVNSITRFTNFTQRFLTWKEIEHWVTLKEKRHPILKKIVLGHTYEKRELFVLRLSTGNNEPSVFLMGGEEGRDWHSPAILLSFINDIIKNNSGLQNLLDLYNIYILPVFNPDGYEYSMHYDPFWKKNRKVFFHEKNCRNKTIPIGVNIDRNWYFTGDTMELEHAECDPVYIGKRSLLEAEPQAVSQFLNILAPNIMAFVNIRGFHRLILLPYADYTDHTSNYAMLLEILTSTCEKLQENFNATYYYGNTASFLFNATGNCADWVKKKLNVPIVYTVYLRYKDYYVPQARHISILKDQFILIIKRTLILAHSIYHPLFNGQVNSILHKAFFMLIFTSLIWKQHTHSCLLSN